MTLPREAKPTSEAMREMRRENAYAHLGDSIASC